MADDFVVIWNPLHRGFADLARKTPIVPVDDRNMVSLGAEEVTDLIHDVEGIEKLASPEYFELLGIPTFYGNGQFARTATTLYIYDYFDATKADNLCRGGLRSKLKMRATSLFSLDLLNYGIGVVRPTRAWSGGFHAVMGKPLGKIEPEGTKVYQTIIARTHIDPDDTEIMHMEDWESTNIVYGDAFGEVQQIKDREGNDTFLETICKGLNHRPISQVYWSDAVKGLHQKHVACQRLWDGPPQSTGELVERVDYVLANSTLDKSPGVSLKLHKVANDDNVIN